MEFIQQNDKILLLWDKSFDLQASEFQAEALKNKFNATINFENIERLDLASYENSSFTLILLKISQNKEAQFLANLLKLMTPKGRIVATSQSPVEFSENLKHAGFVNITTKDNDVLAEKPNYEVGSAAKLSFAKKPAAVWKLDDDDDNELINADDLLDEEDKVKPDPSNLKVCGTTGKRKACKDCSCGLAEELSAEAKKNAPASENAKSSCGSCYLGDAFRCASCPYLGYPAFKPGEKVQLAGGLLKDDL